MLSIAVMAHRARVGFVSELIQSLPSARIVWDRRQGIWDTGRRALLAYDREADWHLVLQDDAILCEDFMAGVRDILRESAQGGPVSFWLSAEVARTLLPGTRPEDAPANVYGPGPWGGVAIALPTKDIVELVSWADRQAVDSYDKRIARYYEAQGKPCRYVLPSLVDHRPLADSPSLLGRAVDSRAFWFEP